MKENGKEWPEKLEEIFRIIFSSLENYGKQSVIRASQVVLPLVGALLNFIHWLGRRKRTECFYFAHSLKIELYRYVLKS